MNDPLGHAAPRFSTSTRAVLERAIILAEERGQDLVTVEILAGVLVELHPHVIDAAVLDARLFQRLGQTNERLAALTTTLTEAIHTMATIADLTAAAQQLADNEGALAAEVTSLAGSVDNLASVVARLRASGNLSDAEQAALDAAVQEVTNTSATLAGETSNLQREQGVADTAANPPQG